MVNLEMIPNRDFRANTISGNIFYCVVKEFIIHSCHTHTIASILALVAWNCMMDFMDIVLGLLNPHLRNHMYSLQMVQRNCNAQCC